MNAAEIIEAAGGPSKLARALGLDHSSVIGWRKANRVPAGRVRAIAEITGLQPHQIRPDLFDPPAAPPSTEATEGAEAGATA